MARTLQISDLGEIQRHLEKINESSCRTINGLKDLCSGDSDAVQLLARMKFEKMGYDPLDPDRPLNIIEQINQTFTYIATLCGTEYLMERHPEAVPFTLKMGAVGGTDIKSDNCGGISAEVFSAVFPSNNNKLYKDIKKVAAATDSVHKYVLFMCPGIERGPYASHAKYQKVQVFSLGGYEECVQRLQWKTGDRWGIRT